MEWVLHSMFDPSLVEGPLDCFQSLTIPDKAAVGQSGMVFMGTPVLTALG